jgi:hypothetical protein
MIAATLPRTGRIRRWLGLTLCAFASSSFAADWQSSLTKDPPGNFPPLRSGRVQYRIGWSGITAGSVEARVSRPSPDRSILEGSGGSIGFVRALWRYDMSYRSVTDTRGMRPVESTQDETLRNKKQSTTLKFTAAGVSRVRTETTKPNDNKPKFFNMANLHDLQSAMLYLRSQPLKSGSVYRMVVYPTTNAYVATLTVSGREKIAVKAGTYNAIKFDLQLSKVGKTLQLEPHRKFKRATVWVSDDNDRIILRIEAQIFVGTVFCELQSAQFEGTES